MSKTKQRRNFWLGIALIVAGLVPAGFLGHAVWNWSRASTWVSTPARVISVDVEAQSPGPKSSSMRLNVEYEYEWEETTFHNTSISPFSGIEVFDSYTRQQRSTLDEAAKEQKAVTCYVNPTNPAVAFLNRDFRWGSSLLFSAVALAFAGGGTLLVRQHYRSEQTTVDANGRKLV